MWEQVVARRHRPQKVFESAFSGGSSTPATGQEGRPEYMLFGEVDYELRTGEKQTAGWAGHAILTEVDGRLKFSYYRVWIQR